MKTALARSTTKDLAYIRKPAGATQFSNKYTAAERKLINFCFGHAAEAGLTIDEYETAVADLEYWRIIPETRNTKWMDDVVTGLVTKPIKWNSFGKDRVQEWGVCTFLASGKIRGDRFRYRLNPEIVDRVKRSKVWGRLWLVAMMNLTSRNAMAVYEYLATELSTRGAGVNEVDAEMTLEDFKALCGFSADQYHEFKTLNRDVLKPVVGEISTATDIEVSVKLLRERRRVVGLLFSVARKTNKQLPLPDDHPVSWDNARPVTRERSEEQIELAALLVDTGVHKTVAERLVEEFDGSRIRSNVTYAKAQKAKGNVKGLGGYVIRAIQDDYGAPLREAEQRETAAQEQAAADQARDAEEAEREAALRKEFEQFQLDRTREIYEAASPDWQSQRKQRFERERVQAIPMLKRELCDTGWDSELLNRQFMAWLSNEVLSARHEIELNAHKEWRRRTYGTS